jgi:hypothetical protein
VTVDKTAFRDAVAFVAAELRGDAEGQRVIVENCDQEAVIGALALVAAHALRIMAEQDRVGENEVVAMLTLRPQTL